ncbi:MAG TPA: DNA-directed RNA polymerase subunit omega [Candidatus Xenobia bacterium]|jgi:DNA-directed RNA polymerase subunit omega
MPHSLDDLLKHAESKFTLVTMVMRRAQDLNNGARPIVAPGDNKVVTVAMDEIATGQIKPVQTDRPPKRGVPTSRRTIPLEDLAA